VTGPIRTLAMARLRRRASSTALAVGAVAAAVALVAVVSGIGLVAADATLERSLSGTGPDRPVVRASRFSYSAADRAEVQAAVERLAPLAAYSRPLIRGILFRELIDASARTFDQVVAVDDPEPLTTLVEGRLPAPCDGQRCEAILLSETAPSPPIEVFRPGGGGLELTIVGRGLLDPALPFGPLDQRGPFGERPTNDQQTGNNAPAVLLVRGVDVMATAAALESTGRTYLFAVPTEPSRIHPWTADDYAATVATVGRQLAEDDAGYTVTSPVPTIGAELSRATAARGRLLLIGSLGVAILLAFAVFAALVARADVAAEVARLSAVGARRRDRVGLVALEALVPSALGGVAGWAVGSVVVAILAGWQGVDPGPVLLGAILSPEAIAVAIAVIAVTALAVTAATMPGLPRTGAVRTAGAVAITAGVLLAWQSAASGALGAGALSSSLVSPLVVLLPPVLAFLVALGFLTVLPPSLRWLTARLRRAPLAVRLSLLSVAREPDRPAATLTLLAFSIGAICFALGWSASLRTGIEDSAAYRSGLDLRVVEIGTGLSISQSVVPVDRYAELGADVTAVPVFRGATEVPVAGRVELLALPPEIIPDMPGWRSDFSSRSPGELAGDLRVPEPAGGWVEQGQRLEPGVRDLVLSLRYEGEQLNLDAVILTNGGDHARIPLGTITEATTELRATLPADAVGGTLTALIFRNDRIIAGPSHQGELRRATVTFQGIDDLVPPEPIDLEVFTVSTETIRAPQVTDGMVIPAIVSPDLQAAVDPDGILRLRVGTDGTIPLRVVATASAFPTVVSAHPQFIVVPYGPYMVALDATLPGIARPSEMWLGIPDAAREADVRSALGLSPFRFPAITARTDLVAAQSGDPLSKAIVWALVAAALAGLVLSVGGVLLGVVTDLRDERGELADLEAQGVSPATLRHHALAKTIWLTGGGAIAGLLAGVGLTVAVTSTLAIGATGAAPIPPLVIVFPIAETLAIVAALLALVVGLVAWLARRTYGGRTLGERRNDRTRDPNSAPAWRAEPGARDG
jgi:hypothetical protein